MSNLSTNMGSFIKTHVPLTNKGPRNKHLVPEVALRSQRILRVAAKEEKQAFQVHPIYCAYYKKLRNGRQCTCRVESIKRDVDKTSQDGAIQLADFLIDTPRLMPAKDNCPICFDSGFVGGYDRTGAFTLTLDYTYQHTTEIVRVEKDRPYIFRPADKEGYVSWKVKIPKYFDSVLDVAIRWDQEPLEWRIDVNGIAMSEEVLLESRNDEVDINLYMKDADNQKAGVYCVFITLKVSDDSLIPSNFPNISTSLTADFNVVNEITSPQSVYFDSTLDKVETTDLFIDTRFMRLWRVLEIEHNRPYDEAIDYRTQSRLVRDFETNHLLPNKLIAGKYPISNLYTFVV